jgi:hypothetical protein
MAFVAAGCDFCCWGTPDSEQKVGDFCLGAEGSGGNKKRFVSDTNLFEELCKEITLQRLKQQTHK